MAELFEEVNYSMLTVAECAECGNEIKFSDEKEFEKLSAEHICFEWWAC